MPRCLMAKKWKAYPWSERAECSGDSELQNTNEFITLNRDVVFIDTKRTRIEFHEEQQQQVIALQTDDEEIDVVGDVDINRCSNRVVGQTNIEHQTCWGPHSPTAGATAPSPPPLNASGALYYHGYTHEAWINHEEPPKYATLRSAAELARPRVFSPTSSHHHIQDFQEQPDNSNHSILSSLQHSHHHQQQSIHQNTTVSSSITLPPRKSLSMCFTSTGTALSLPPKKKDIYRPYSLQPNEIRSSAEEDLSAAQAILDLSASPAAPTHSIFIHTLSPASPSLSQPSILHQPQLPVPIPVSVLVPIPICQNLQQQPLKSNEKTSEPSASSETNINNINNNATINVSNPTNNSSSPNKTVAYTYEAFFVSDGRSKRRTSNSSISDKESVSQVDRPKFTCTECGKQYATSSNLSRHKQTHRSLDSQSAKKCIHCGKAYVSMPALAMHVLTHKLAHSCGVCGKMFSRPWLLQGHLRSHTGEKPYGCAHCGKAFADRSNLRAHMQTHSADKNYECSRCHKTFALKSYLNKHLESACLREDDMHNSVIINGSQHHQLQTNRGL